MDEHSIGVLAGQVAQDILGVVVVSGQVTFFMGLPNYIDIDVPRSIDTARARSGECGGVSACLMRSHFRIQPTDRP